MDLTSATAIAALYQFDHLQCCKGMLINACIQEHGVYMHTRTLVRCLHVTKASLVLALGQHVRNMQACCMQIPKFVLSPCSSLLILIQLQICGGRGCACQIGRYHRMFSIICEGECASRGHACDNYKTRWRSWSRTEKRFCAGPVVAYNRFCCF